MKFTVRTKAFLLALLVSVGCNAKERIEELIDVIEVDRKPIDISKTGVNAFANDGRFGSIRSQLNEVHSTLGLGFIRILFAWNDEIQSSPSDDPNFALYDAIADAIPDGVDAMAVLTDVPSWMSNSENWIDGDPRKTFAEKWVKIVAKRYAGNSKISSFEIWNEPNMPGRRDNSILGLETDPGAFVALLSFSSSAVKSIAPNKRIVSGATTAINQNFPDTLNYNKAAQDLGAEGVVDIWGVHYYGRQYERVVTENGVADFLNGLSKPIWITESGAQGVNNQLAYVEQTWPFLSEKIPGIRRFFYYQFTEATSPEQTYGLRNLSSDFPVSDLYLYLKAN